MKNNSQIDLTLPKCSCFLPLGWKCWNQLPCIPSLPFSKKKHGDKNGHRTGKNALRPGQVNFFSRNMVERWTKKEFWSSHSAKATHGERQNPLLTTWYWISRLTDIFYLAGILFPIWTPGTHHCPSQKRKVHTLEHTITHSVIHEGKFYFS